jgi:hypothetical protein
LSAVNIDSVASSSSLRKTLSVISSSSRAGAIPNSASALVTMRGQRRVGELQRRDVDRDPHRFRPACRFVQAVAQRPFADRRDQAASSATGTNLAGEIMPCAPDGSSAAAPRTR